MASHAVEIEDTSICVFLLMHSVSYRIFNHQRWDKPDGIYVFHFFAPSLIPDLPLEDTARGYALRLAAYATLTFLIAATSWRFYERPLNRLKILVPYSYFPAQK